LVTEDPPHAAQFLAQVVQDAETILTDYPSAIFGPLMISKSNDLTATAFVVRLSGG
jgi:hypothetical protein